MMNHEKNNNLQPESPFNTKEQKNRGFGSQPADHEQTSKSSISYAYGAPNFE
jgi:hypothetical protein